MRAMTAGMQADLGQPNQAPVRLVEIRFDSGTQHHTTAHRDITWNGNTYLAGNLMSISGIAESLSGQTPTASVKLAGANQANLTTALLEPFVDRPVYIYRGSLDANDNLVADPFLEFVGYIDRPAYQEDPLAGTASLTWHIASRFARFDAVSGRRTTHEDQQVHFPGDLFFEAASKNLSDAPWGRA